MDINSLNAYTDYLSSSVSSNNTKAANTVNKDYSNATDEELMGACKEFEAYFLEQVFKEMWKTVKTEDDSASASIGTLKDYFQGEFVKEMASQATEQQSNGLAQMLYEQMKRNYDL